MPSRKKPASETKNEQPAETEITPTANEKEKKKSTRKRKSGKSLVIVESPAKAKTIQKYLGPGFEVAASYGHVRDLPPRPRGGNIGIDIEAGWKPTYVILEENNKKKILSELKKKSSQADVVYLAPDPDREGEAIAWHLKEALQLPDERVRRVTFNEITKRAIEEAFSHPGQIDMDRVKAQEARRFLDRAVGYKLSPLLGKKIARGLSAGRVQSVAVRLIVEREREIEAFKPEEYWRIAALLTPDESRREAEVAARILKRPKPTKEETDESEDEEGEAQPLLQAESGKSFVAELAEWDGKKFRAGNEEQALAVARALEKAEFTVTEVEEKERREKPQPPFTTSTLQQQANIRLGFSARHTMAVAQQLYEGVDLGPEGSVALITYMRTDSTRVSQDALDAVRKHIRDAFGEQYLPAKPHAYATGKAAQEAHEAIRPTDVRYTPEKVRPYLTDHQRKLYELIWRRFVASQMKPAVFAVTNVTVQADKGVFKAQGKVLKFDGYRRVLSPRGKREDTILPHLENRQRLYLLDLLASQHFTKPPPRYKEASLVKALEKEGIGRPSTYAPIISKIQERKYVVQKNRRFYATELGKLVTDKLVQHFPEVMNVKFTSQMERELDQIEERELDQLKVLNDFWEPFSQALKAAQEQMEAAKHEETGEKCPECGRPLVWRYSTKTEGERFAGCSGYPECRYIQRPGQPDRKEPEPTDIPCPTCGKPMMRHEGQFGAFLRCSRYPECQTKMKFDAQGKPVLAAQSTEHVCDKCGKPMVLREGPRGKFLGCTGYPKCRNLVEVDEQGNPIKPAETGINCEKCGKPMIVRRGPRGPFLGCSAYPKCRSTRPIPEELKEKLKDQLPPPSKAKPIPKVEIDEKCPNCGAPMELRRGRRGYFLGCSTFAKTKCKGSKEVPEELLAKIEAAEADSQSQAATVEK